jgi:hypothetical protein
MQNVKALWANAAANLVGAGMWEVFLFFRFLGGYPGG